MRVFIALAAVCLPFSTLAAPFEPGEWEITTRMEGMPGMPANMPAHTFRQCLTPQDNVPKQEGKMDPRCKMLESSMSGNTTKWKMRCDMPEGVTTSEGTVTYQGNSFAGTTHMQAQYGKQKMNMSSKMSGKRLGACPAQPAGKK